MRLSLDMPAQLAAIDTMVADLRQAVAPFLTAEDLFGFEVAASEALTNVVKHSHDPADHGHHGRVTVTLCADATFITLDLLDHGKPGPADMFARVPRLEDIDIFAEHGRGLALIQHYSDQVVYRTDQTGNRLQLRFKTSSPSQPEAE